ncbi:MAG: hypothetical protein Q8K65_01540 [Alphaproteobacteria bacterium]|nr:hypothetical protein [Alphaproteobacteria bacterium]
MTISPTAALPAGLSAAVLTVEDAADHDTRGAAANGLPKRKKFWLSRAFAKVAPKVADIAGRAAFTNALKIGALSAVAGAGASAVVSAGVAALAAGAGAAVYSYGKDTFSAWHKAQRDHDDSFRWVDTERLKKARTALLFGVAGGAFGAWLAGTDTFQHGLELAKTYGGKMIESALGFFSGNVHASPAVPAAAFSATVFSADDISVRIDAAHAAVAAPQVSEDDIIARIDAAHGLLDAERSALEVVPAEEIAAPKNALGKLWEAAMTSDQAKGHFMAQMLTADPDDLSSVTPQFLKDRAHDVLRLTDLPWQDRLSLARELAEAAEARGNRQATGFLRDLAKLEDGTWKPRGLNISGDEAAPKAATLKAAPEIKPDILQPEITAEEIMPQEIIAPEMPIKTVILETDPVTSAVSERIVDAIRGEGLRIEPMPDAMTEPVMAAPARAAVCTVTLAGDLSAAESFCQVSKPVMQAGDYIAFVAAGAPELTVKTPLLDGSVDVPTQAFLHEKLIGDGVSRLSSAAKLAPR